MSVAGADDVLDVLLGFIDQVIGEQPVAVMGHSAGGYFAQAIAAARPEQTAGLGLVCPLLAGTRDVPAQRAVSGPGNIGDEEFRGYFVVQTPAMLTRYQQYVEPAAALADQTAMARLGAHWEFTRQHGTTYEGPTLLIAGRQDSTVGYAATQDLLDRYPRATLTVLDGAGHALPHEQPDILQALVNHWMDAVG